jgi:hypothetical protein
MGWFSRRTKESPAPPLEELSAGLQSALRTVGAACATCEQAHSDEFVTAWRGLHLALRMAIAGLGGLLGETPSPRVERMVRLATEELWDIAERHLVAYVPTTPADMALLRRNLWDRAAAARDARDRLRRMADQVDAAVDALGGGTDDDRRDAAELRRFVHR